MIYVPNRRKAFQAAAGGNGLLTGLLNYVDLGTSLLDDVGSADFTATGTSVSSGTAPDGGDTRLFAIGEFLETPAGNVWASGTTMTISVWVRMESATSNGHVYAHNAPNGYSYIQYLASTDKFRWFFDGGFNGDSSVLSAYLNWKLLVITTNGPGTGGDEMFVDNTSVETATNGWEPGSAIFYMGCNQTGGAAGMVGQMQGLSVWNRILTADDRTALYNSGTNLRFSDYT
jgi:hypothetical protein